MMRSRALATLLLGLLLPPAPPASGAIDIPFTRVVIDANKPDGPDAKTVGDIDGDGLPDVIVASSTGGGMVWSRAPGWTKHVIRASGGWTTDMQVGDVDGDGDLDVIAPNGSGIVWYQNPRPAGDPATAFWPEFLIGVDGANNHDVEVGDLNGDGKLDVVTRQHGGGTSVWIQSTPTDWIRVNPSNDSGEGTSLGDLDGDGDLDIAHNGFWLENPLPGGDLFGAWPHHTIDADWLGVLVGVLIADVNGDGRNDVVLAPSESADGRFSWYEAADPRNGPWVEHLIDASVSYFHTFKAADMDGDGDLDLVTAEMHQSADPDEVSVYRNEGGGLAWSQQVVATTGSHNLRIADFDADGDIDIVGVNWHESSQDGAAVTVWRNQLQTASPFDGDRRADVAVYRPTTGQWLVRPSAGGSITLTWGDPAQQDVPLSADFDGDGQGDIAVYRGATGQWFVLRSGGGVTILTWGDPAQLDVPVAADFDGDGRADVGVYRGGTGQWFVLLSGGGAVILTWGDPAQLDLPVPADFDGDGRADIAVYRVTTGQWFVLHSAGGVTILTWGDPAQLDVPVPGRYDADGRADFAVYRKASGQWFVLHSAGGLTILTWGDPAQLDLPVAADFDGDGRADIAVYRQASGHWFVLLSGGGVLFVQWGEPVLGDAPVPLG